jgi:uncharacterized membrane protein
VSGIASLAASPLLPWTVLGPLLGLAAVAMLAGFAARGRGRWWRAVLLGTLALALIQPSIINEQREPLKDVAIIVVDRSPSQRLSGRAERTETAVAALKSQLAAFPDLETRIVDSDASPIADETDLFGPRGEALSDIPRDRLAGTFLITDGEVHDVPRPVAGGGPTGADAEGPIHVLLTGRRDERDRRLEIVDAPGYGIVGNSVTVTVRVVDTNIPAHGPAEISVSQDGGPPRTLSADIGATVPIEIPLSHGGPTTIELAAMPVAGELTEANNRAVVVVNGVRERLRVLLISGEPHAGERTWRNLLKADPSVDLVHFTILRPPEKNDGTPFNELSLIAFPIAELFDLRLHEFDLIIFDHYQQMLLLPEYYRNLADYVRKGGALLEASGPGFEGPSSLYRTALKDVLPGAPTGRELDEPFKPLVTELGDRHPVTTELPGTRNDGPPDWGRWFRQGEITPAGPESATVMTGAEGKPLLMLAHAGEGRVAQLASDQIWLWSRGFEGGGPQAELLRRLAHWLMKEPELDENQLTATVKNRQITIARRTLLPGTGPATISLTGPDGDKREVTLADAGHGVARATIQADAIGLYKIGDGTRTAFAVVGSVDTPELRDVLTTEDRLAPIVRQTGGTIVWLADDEKLDIRRVDAEAPTGGRGWMGLRRNGRYTVRGVTETPLLPIPILLIVLAGALGASWYREGR